MSDQHPESFNCERHPTVVVIVGGDGCRECLAMLDRLVTEMTPEERADEVRSWLHAKMSVPFSRIHERVEALVGRPVWTHEFGLAADRLIAEAGGAEQPVSMDVIVNDLRNTGKPVIEVRDA